MENEKEYIARRTKYVKKRLTIVVVVYVFLALLVFVVNENPELSMLILTYFLYELVSVFADRYKEKVEQEYSDNKFYNDEVSKFVFKAKGYTLIAAFVATTLLTSIF